MVQKVLKIVLNVLKGFRSSFKCFKRFKRFLKVSDVEQAQSALQFSTSVELEVGIVLVVSWLRVFLENGSKDFLDFWHEVRGS